MLLWTGRHFPEGEWWKRSYKEYIYHKQMSNMLAVLCLIFAVLLGAPTGKSLETNDFHEGHLEYTVEKLECNDASTVCTKCFTVHKYGRNYLYTFKLYKDSGAIHFKPSTGEQDWELSISQDNYREPFRYCVGFESRMDVELNGLWKGLMCIDNRLFKLEVPDDCVEPIAQVYVLSHLDDTDPRGQKTVYCI